MLEMGNKWFSRRRVMQMASASALAAAGCLAYARFVEPNRLVVKELSIKVAGLPAAFDGLRLAHLTDIHFEQGKDEELLQKVVDTISEVSPDVIIHTGDYLSKGMESFDALMEFIGRMEPALASYAIMGNHDCWYGDRARIQRAFESVGTQFLVNGSTQLNLRGESLAFVGLDSVWGGKPDIDRAFQAVDKDSACMVLMHEPDYFDNISLSRDRFLQFSGHTHGGQCRVPWLEYGPVKVLYGEIYIDGYYQNKAEQQLYVSSGIGTTGMRVRFGCVPEVVVLTLLAN